jgi:hypothetical protein
MIKFGTSGWRGIMAEEFTFANVRKVVGAIGDVLAQDPKRDRPVIVGYDTRFLSPEFARTAAEILSAKGFKVLFTKGANHDRRDGQLFFFQLFEKLKSAQIRHRAVGDQQIECCGAKKRHRLESVFRLNDFIAFRFQNLAHKAAGIFVVIDDQYVFFGHLRGLPLFYFTGEFLEDIVRFGPVTGLRPNMKRRFIRIGQ